MIFPGDLQSVGQISYHQKIQLHHRRTSILNCLLTKDLTSNIICSVLLTQIPELNVVKSRLRKSPGLKVNYL